MNLITVIALALEISIFSMEFSLGLRASPEESLYLLRRPGLLARSLLAMNVVMPLFAVAIVFTFDLHKAVEIALVALSLSPIPPLLPKKQAKAGGSHAYIVGLLAGAALLSIVFIPLALGVLGKTFAIPLHMSPLAIIKIVLLLLLTPLVLGMIIRLLAPRFAEKIVNPLTKISLLVLVAAALPILFIAGPAIWSLIGNGTILAIAAFTLVGMAVGHFLGGPGKETRSVLALATASRHPGIAMAIAKTNFPEDKNMVIAAILLYLIVSGLVSLPYLMKRSS